MGSPGCFGKGLGSSRNVYGGAWGRPKMKGSVPGRLQRPPPKIEISVSLLLKFYPLRSRRDKYDVVLVIGANDGFRGIDPELIKTNIQKIVKELKHQQVVVVLGAMQIVQNLGKDYTTTFANIYPEIAKSENIILTPFFLEGVAAERRLNQTDGIHPTAEGYQVIVNNITASVVEAIKAHRKR